MPYSIEARYYDKLYGFKNYRAEADKLIDLIAARQRTPGKRLLDAACGTGGHIEFLCNHFDVQGLDFSAEMLAVARQRFPALRFWQADMADFELGDRFDVITCLFSAIGYTRTLERMAQAVACLGRHLLPGGLLIIEPWFAPEAFQAGTVHTLLIDEPQLKIARLNTSLVEGRVSVMDFHYLVATPSGTEHFVERHELGLFTPGQMRAAFEQADLQVEYDPVGLTGRGLYLGRAAG